MNSSTAPPTVTRDEAVVAMLLTPTEATVLGEALRSYADICERPADELTDRMYVDPSTPDAPAFAPPVGWEPEVWHHVATRLLAEASRVGASPGQVVMVPRYDLPQHAEVATR